MRHALVSNISCKYIPLTVAEWLPFMTNNSGHYICNRMYMETHLLLRTSKRPHVTVLSIQPHLANASESQTRGGDLDERPLDTEFWTLYYWAQLHAKRSRSYSYLPVSEVALSA